MAVPADRKYAKTHEWHKVEGDIVILGITDHAAEELTDITYVQLPEVGRKVSAGESIGELESVKATSEFYTGISGEIVEVNEKLNDEPGLINSDPFGESWLVKIKPSEMSELDKLLSAEEYQASIS